MPREAVLERPVGARSSGRPAGESSTRAQGQADAERGRASMVLDVVRSGVPPAQKRTGIGDEVLWRTGSLLSGAVSLAA
jgi:hypothetical protein